MSVLKKNDLPNIISAVQYIKDSAIVSYSKTTEKKYPIQQTDKNGPSLSPDKIENSEYLSEQIEILQAEDKNPFYFVVRVLVGENNQANGNIGDFYYESDFLQIYTKEWAESFLKVLEMKPIGGAKEGHQTWVEESVKTPPNDIYIIGGKMTDSETLFLKAYVPNFDGDSDRLIRDIKVSMNSISIVTKSKVEWIYEDDYDYSDLIGVRFTEHVGSERVDLIPYGDGGMSAGIISHNKNNNGGTPLMGEEKTNNPNILITQLKNMYDAGRITTEQMSDAGFPVVTSAQRAELNAVNSIKKLFPGKEDILSEIETLMTENSGYKDKIFDYELSKILTGICGENLSDGSNTYYVLSESLVRSAMNSNPKLTIEKAMQEISENPAIKALSANKADFRKNPIRTKVIPGKNAELKTVITESDDIGMNKSVI